MKVLAIGAHPDDIEIFMFGLLYLLKEQGHEIFMCVATDGSKGGQHPSKDLAKIRKKETILALKPIGIPKMLNLIDGELHYSNTSKKIVSLIDKIKPDLVITHSINDYHSDHRTLSLYIQNATSFKCPIIYCDTLMGVNFNPNYYVDITDYYELKKEAILKHKTQNPDRFVDLFELMNSYRAAQCNAPKGNFAEAYSFIPSFPFSDIREILPLALKLRPFHIENQHGFL